MTETKLPRSDFAHRQQYCLGFRLNPGMDLLALALARGGAGGFAIFHDKAKNY
jgi:hypothetical protein